MENPVVAEPFSRVGLESVIMPPLEAGRARGNAVANGNIPSRRLVLRSPAVDLSEGEDIPETTHPVAETRDHGRRPKLPSEPQTGMATNEIVVTTCEFELPVQSPLTTRMGRTTSTQIGDRLPNCQIETFDIRHVRARRILRFVERLLQSSSRTDNRSTLHSCDTVFPPGLDDLCVDASDTE